jgi:uncharacterized protein (UPF0332 family)
MTQEQRDLLRKAATSHDAAQVLLDTGYPEYAAARAYYSMYYVAEAFLEGLGLSFSKHSAVIAAFGREIAKPGLVPLEFHRHLIEAQEVRHMGDYGSPDEVTDDRAREQITRAAAFLDAAVERLGTP